MKLFLSIVVLHFGEHIAQLVELYVLKMPRPECLGLLGIAYPYAMRSEWLHYAYALFMLVGLYYFKDLARSWRWWRTTLWLQHYHHFEHLLLLIQFLIGINLFNSAVPCSIGQIWFKRIELHFIYNLMVIIPMLMAFYPLPKKTIGDSL
jgi:hypothetical protein